MKPAGYVVLTGVVGWTVVIVATALLLYSGAMLALGTLRISGDLSTGPAIQPASTTTSTTPRPMPVPDVIGLPVVTAVTILSDAGIEAIEVEVPYVIAAGTVLSQSVPAGSVHTSPIELRVSVAPVTPSFIGTDIAAALDFAAVVGASVDVTQVSSLEFARGTVFAQRPAAGDLLMSALALSVAREPDTSVLGELNPVNLQRCFTRLIDTADGRVRAWVCEERFGTTARIEFDITGAIVARIQMFTASGTETAVVNALVDGSVVFSDFVGSALEALAVDLESSTRLTFLVSGDAVPVAIRATIYWGDQR